MSLKLEIAGITTEVIRQGSSFNYKLDEVYRQFSSNKKPQIKITVSKERFPETANLKKIFDSSASWQLYRNSRHYIFTLPFQRLYITHDFTEGKFYRRCADSDDFFPWRYPFDQLLMIGYLGKAKGVMVHSCGVFFNGEGMLFLGASGTGKSTLSSVLSKQGASILSDDRIVIRKDSNGAFIYGTPWQGEAQFSLSKRAPLKKIFFIKHAQKNYIQEIKPADALARFISCSFIPFWNKKGIEFTIDFFSQLLIDYPVYEFGFVPDISAYHFVQSKYYELCGC
jgi:hypothetical protein